MKSLLQSKLTPSNASGCCGKIRVPADGADGRISSALCKPKYWALARALYLILFYIFLSQFCSRAGFYPLNDRDHTPSIRSHNAHTAKPLPIMPAHHNYVHRRASVAMVGNTLIWLIAPLSIVQCRLELVSLSTASCNSKVPPRPVHESKYNGSTCLVNLIRFRPRKAWLSVFALLSLHHHIDSRHRCKVQPSPLCL